MRRPDATPCTAETLSKRPQQSSRRAPARRRRRAPRPSRLLNLAEQHNSGQIARIARFIAATYNGHEFPFDLFELRAVDVDISDNMLRWLDALRWASADLYRLVPDGDARVRATIARWGLRWNDGD
jgi:hypothetical protein